MLKIELKSYKNIKVISLAITALLLTALYFFYSSKPAIYQDIKIVDATKVLKKNISQTIKLTGKIRPKLSASLAAKSPGIFNIIIPAGTKVTKDTVIAKINNIEIEKRYELLKEAESIAQEQFTRAQNLLKSGAYSKAELEALQNKWINAQKDLADAKIAFDKLVIYAPFDGIIGSYKPKEGAQLKGDETIVSFYDPSNITLDFDIPSSAVPYVNNGQNISVKGKNYKLTHVQKMLDEEKHMSPASVDIICDDCIIGSNINLELTIIDRNDALIIPLEATFLFSGKQSVYIIKDNKADLKQIEIGLRQKDELEVISGLNEGDVIVAKGTTRLYPGASIKTHGINNESN